MAITEVPHAARPILRQPTLADVHSTGHVQGPRVNQVATVTAWTEHHNKNVRTERRFSPLRAPSVDGGLARCYRQAAEVGEPRPPLGEVCTTRRGEQRDHLARPRIAAWRLGVPIPLGVILGATTMGSAGIERDEYAERPGDGLHHRKGNAPLGTGGDLPRWASVALRTKGSRGKARWDLERTGPWKLGCRQACKRAGGSMAKQAEKHGGFFLLCQGKVAHQGR